MTLHNKAAPESRRAVTLSAARDRFGDPYAHVYYDLSGFDEATYAYGRRLFDRVATATGGRQSHADDGRLGDADRRPPDGTDVMTRPAHPRLSRRAVTVSSDVRLPIT